MLQTAVPPEIKAVVWVSEQSSRACFAAKVQVGVVQLFHIARKSNFLGGGKALQYSRCSNSRGTSGRI